LKSVEGIKKMTSQNETRNDPNSWNLRLLAVTLAAAVIVSSGGCLTAEWVSSEEPRPVTQAAAKRDLGIDYLSSRRTAMAIRELKASMQLDPSDPQTHLWLGESYRRKGRTEEAEAYLLDAIMLSEDDRHSLTQQAALLTLSALLSQMGRYEDSLEHCEALTEDATFSAPWRSLTNCGWALMKLGRTEEARTHFEDALDFFPRFGPALLNLGVLQAEEGHALLAIRTLQRAIESGRLGASALSETHFRLGEIYVGLGRRDMAVAQFKESTTKAPYGGWGTQSQAYLDLLH
jgi:type IV pilus assembly protein PilF